MKEKIRPCDVVGWWLNHVNRNWMLYSWDNYYGVFVEAKTTLRMFISSVVLTQKFDKFPIVISVFLTGGLLMMSICTYKIFWFVNEKRVNMLMCNMKHIFLCFTSCCECIVKVSVAPRNASYFGRYIISDCIDCTNESICLLYQINITTCFGSCWPS
jgi:hypothetical protein